MSLFPFFPFKARAETSPPRLPHGVATYAVGDIHGRSDLLDCLLDKIVQDAAVYDGNGVRRIVFLGDYVDRGPDSRGVLERLANLKMDGFENIFLIGNHDAFLLDFLDRPRENKNWLSYGGEATLLSYGVRRGPGSDWLPDMRDKLASVMPPEHLRFLRGLQVYHVEGDYLFVHAGVRPGVPLEKQSKADMLWIKKDFVESSRSHRYLVVHGHTITMQPDVRPNRIGIDTGAYNSGVLTCLVLENGDRRFIQT